MFSFITSERYDEYDEYIKASPKGHFMQSRKWTEVKSSWKWDAVLTERDGKICGSMAALFRKLPGTPYTMMYCCRGPVCDIQDQKTVTELLEGVKVLAKSAVSSPG